MRALAAVALVLLNLGCGEVSATNPFDPGSPATVQAEGRVEGRVVLPEGFDADLVQEAEILLVRFSAPAEVAYRTNAGAEGEFSIRVQPSTYVVRVQLAGFVTDSIEAEVEIGAVLDLGELSPTPQVVASVAGTARRAGLGAEGPGGVGVGG